MEECDHKYYVIEDHKSYQVLVCFNCSDRKILQKPWDGIERRWKDENTRYKRRRTDVLGTVKEAEE